MWFMILAPWLKQNESPPAGSVWSSVGIALLCMMETQEVVIWFPYTVVWLFWIIFSFGFHCELFRWTHYSLYHSGGVLTNGREPINLKQGLSQEYSVSYIWEVECGEVMMLQYVFSGKFQMNIIIVSMSKSGSLKTLLEAWKKKFLFFWSELCPPVLPPCSRSHCFQGVHFIMVLYVMRLGIGSDIICLPKAPEASEMSTIIIAYHVLYCSYTEGNTTSFWLCFFQYFYSLAKTVFLVYISYILYFFNTCIDLL